jgi:UDP-N-acetylglucosamine:LPS N-acetylglucosamine transferase/quercetin dioxygenase-like cupin family protein
MPDHGIMRETREDEATSSVTSTRLDDILILTASTGAGHDSVAVALLEAIREDAPDVRVRVLDALSGKRAHRTMSLGHWYDATVAHAPWLWGLSYRATNNSWAVRHGMSVVTRLWAAQLRDAIRAGKPGVVVAVHPLCARLAADVLRNMTDAPPLHCVVTDLVTFHHWWACDAVARFYVATPDARDALITQGIPPERIQVTGLPLRASFASPPHPPCKDVVPRVLLLGGGRPSRRMEKIARAFVASPRPVHLVVVCGRDRRLRQRLESSLGKRATVLGWHDDIASLMRWSDVVVARGGPTTVAEALSQLRPLLLYQALRGQETGNVVLAERTGAGRYIPDVDALVRAVTTGDVPRPSIAAARVGDPRSAAHRVSRQLVTALKERSATASPAEVPQPYEEDAGAVGQVICNPISGERIVIRQTGAETAGRLLAFDLYLPPGGHVPARHVHPSQEERFTIVEGRMSFRLGWRPTIMAGPGETVVVPPGTSHWFGNPDRSVSHARVEARPALRLQEVFERSATLQVVEYFPGLRMPRLADLAVLMIEFQRELAVPAVPAFLVKACLAPFAWLGKRRSSDDGRGSTP